MSVSKPAAMAHQLQSEGHSKIFITVDNSGRRDLKTIEGKKSSRGALIPLISCLYDYYSVNCTSDCIIVKLIAHTFGSNDHIIKIFNINGFVFLTNACIKISASCYVICNHQTSILSTKQQQWLRAISSQLSFFTTKSAHGACFTGSVYVQCTQHITSNAQYFVYLKSKRMIAQTKSTNLLLLLLLP